jgi:urea transport system ATP-binding protein
MQNPLLSVENITVSFDGFNALDGISLQLMPTSIRVLIGPNGAGKSTLLDTIIGNVRPTKGRIVFQGEDITELNEYKIVRRGICRKFQAPGILENLSVFDNLSLAARPRRESWRSFGVGAAPQVRARVERVLERIGLAQKRNSLAAQLSHGQKQWLEIGMVVSSDADLLLLDEPAAGMSLDESAQTAELIRSLARDHSFLVIDHDMTFVEQLNAPVSVMHMGRMLKEGTLREIQCDPQVIAVYLGREKEEVVA